jgi:hypothetical protein
MRETIAIANLLTGRDRHSAKFLAYYRQMQANVKRDA